MTEIRMPTCPKHFFKGHQRKCAGCDIATENELKELVEMLRQRRLSDNLWASLEL